MATFIYSTKGRSRESILTYTHAGVHIDMAVNKFVDKLFSIKRKELAAKRLSFVRGKYLYVPSDEYNQLAAKFIRFKPMK